MAMAPNFDEGFAEYSYMFLHPEDANFFDILRILFSRNIGHRKCVESHSEGDLEESFRKRWLIVVSIVVQKIMMFIAKPLAYLGYCIEMFINFVALNEGIFMIIPNFLTGHLIIPNPKSPKYLSCIGSLDPRVKFDIPKVEERGYRVYLAMMASKACYENVAFLKSTITYDWKMKFVGFFDCWNEYQGKATTQVLIVLDKYKDRETYVVAFRGTEPFDADAWCTDLDISWYGIPGIGRMHGGFVKALGLQKNLEWLKEIKRDEKLPPLAYYIIRDILRKGLSENPNAKFILTGHSLGGALATLFPTFMFLHDEKLLIERLEGIYTFGQPRVGDEYYARYMSQRMKENSITYCRFVYCNDIVPRLPYDDKDMMFKHFGICFSFNRRYELEVLEVLHNNNYFSPWSVIPMRLNALLELVRSFTITFKNGRYYREGWFLFFFRMIGILIPGLPAHCPPDYINSTLLGSIERHFEEE